MSGKTTKTHERYNWPVTILLIIGLITVLFPLYLTIVIAFKQPSEMSNTLESILCLPRTWDFSNFAEAIEVTDFWNSLGASVLVTAATMGLAIIVHSLAGYVIGRAMQSHKGFKLSYYSIVSGMFVPFAILMMPLIKQTAEMHLDNIVGVILLYTVYKSTFIGM